MTFIQPCSKEINVPTASIPIDFVKTFPISPTTPTTPLIMSPTNLKATPNPSTVTAATFKTSLIIIPNSEPSVVRFVNAVATLFNCPCIVLAAIKASFAALPCAFA